MTFFQPPIGFSFSVGNLDGQIAAHTYLTLFNPVTSDRILVVGGVFISSEANAASATTEQMRGFRITDASGGVLQPASNIGSFDTRRPGPVAEVRTGGPTVTFGPQVLNAPPPTSPGAYSSGNVNQITVPPGFGGFNLLPGEGLAMHTSGGDIAQRWNLSIVWGER